MQHYKLTAHHRQVRWYRTDVAAVNNYLLALWMIIFGVSLLRHSPAILIRQPI